MAPDASEAKQLLVFVHGWRMTQWDYESFSNTMFKRLYWAGYRGRFASLRWPTLSATTDPSFLQYLTFNRSEYIAFKCAQGTEQYFRHLRDRFPEYAIDVAAHSQGNILMMQTLTRFLQSGSPVIDNYALMEGAVAAHCYDTTITNYFPFVVGVDPTPDVYRGYPGAINAALRPGGHMVNFFNELDFAVGLSWEANQTLNKPDGMFGYQYLGTNGSYRINRLLTDAPEIMAFVARPRSKGVGTQAGVGGVIQGGQVDLHAQFGFTGGKDDHSGQFNRNVQVVLPFYDELMFRLGL